MIINGFQKMTLLDFPGKVACTIFTAGCNMRCPFCHNASLVTEIDASQNISQEEILSYLEKRQGLLDGVCITGGEPLLQKGIEEFIAGIKALGYAVKVDTNGCYPQKLKEIVEKGLVDYVAMDIKNSFAKYGETVGIKDFDLAPVKESISFLISSGIDFEFRTTIVKELHTVEDIAVLSGEIKGAKKYFLQNFVDSGNLIGENLSAHEKSVLEEMKKAAEQNLPSVSIRGI